MRLPSDRPDLPAGAAGAARLRRARAGHRHRRPQEHQCVDRSRPAAVRRDRTPARTTRRVPPPAGASPLVATASSSNGKGGQDRTVSGEKCPIPTGVLVVKGGQDRTLFELPTPETRTETPAETPAAYARAGSEPQNPRTQADPNPFRAEFARLDPRRADLRHRSRSNGDERSASISPKCDEASGSGDGNAAHQRYVFGLTCSIEGQARGRSSRRRPRKAPPDPPLKEPGTRGQSRVRPLWGMPQSRKAIVRRKANVGVVADLRHAMAAVGCAIELDLIPV